jgi:hypothetical protein
MVEASPGGMGRAELAFRGVQWAVTHTGLSRRTVHRRVDAWLAGDRTPYAIKSTTRPSRRGDRRLDPVDVERVRLQETGRLGPEVTADRWRELIKERDIPWLYVTNEAWFRDVVGSPPPG